MQSKLLFIIKKREDVDEAGNKKLLQTGLYNSASYLNDMLNDMGIKSNVEIAIDNNCIDRLVTKHRPTHVIIEALWVVPTKFIILCKLHPTVTWIIRMHSEMPFIACEGIAMTWIGKYSIFKNIKVGVNAPRFLREIRSFVEIKNNFSSKDAEDKVLYLPNYYPISDYKVKTYNKDKETIDISCFGAIRPLKNQLIQAMSAIEFAKEINKKLRYHINATRHEGNGIAVYNNIKGLFSELQSDKYELVEHAWYDKDQFHDICGQMDIGMQVSFSETFNIVACDHLFNGVPIVYSNDIPWINEKYAADPNNSLDIKDKLLLTYENMEDNVNLNADSLKNYVNQTKEAWFYTFNKC
jgi:hypothetical protein